MRLVKDLALAWRMFLRDRTTMAICWPFSRRFYSPPCLFCGNRTTYREGERVDFKVCDWQLFGPTATYSLCWGCALNHQIDCAAGMVKPSLETVRG